MLHTLKHISYTIEYDDEFTITFKVNSMDERFRNDDRSGADEYFKCYAPCFEIRSLSFPELDLDCDQIFLRGSNYNKDACICRYETSDEHAATNMIDSINEALKYWDSHWFDEMFGYDDDVIVEFFD